MTEFRPKIRRNVNDLIRMIENDYNPLFRSCITCDNFDEVSELCKVWKARPPARVIAYGCDSYKDDNWIPF